MVNYLPHYLSPKALISLKDWRRISLVISSVILMIPLNVLQFSHLFNNSRTDLE